MCFPDKSFILGFRFPFFEVLYLESTPWRGIEGMKTVLYPTYFGSAWNRIAIILLLGCDPILLRDEASSRKYSGIDSNTQFDHAAGKLHWGEEFHFTFCSITIKRL